MTFTIKEIYSKTDLKRFIKFPFELYRHNEYYVPPLINFELSTLLKDKNPAFDHAKACYWIVEDGTQIVGRIAAISLDHEIKEKNLARFGWVDFIDNSEVSTLLFEAAQQWALSQGATTIHGPMGFTDLDFEGALVDGFNELPSQATIYNYPYYIDHYKNWGLEASATWVEMSGLMPSVVPKKIARTASLVSSRFKIRALKINKTKDILKYAPAIFETLNESYAHLYGYHALTPKQIAYYTEQYFGFAKKDYICILVNENDDVVGFGISFPSLSKALQKAKGSFFPFGFLHIIKAFYFNRHVDLFLIGVIPKYQHMGAPTIIIEKLMSAFSKNAVQYITSGPMLENNNAVLNLWNESKFEPRTRRSTFKKNF